jgi:hypothetical protein
MPATEPDTAEPRPVAAAALELAAPRSVQATGARWRCGLAYEVDATRIAEGTSQ